MKPEAWEPQPALGKGCREAESLEPASLPPSVCYQEAEVESYSQELTPETVMNGTRGPCVCWQWEENSLSQWSDASTTSFKSRPLAPQSCELCEDFHTCSCLHALLLLSGCNQALSRSLFHSGVSC